MSIAAEEVREFERQRPRLFAIAYRLLGSASEAEDAVQDTYLRWSAADHGAVRTPGAWLTKVLTNLCLTRLTSARARRETYVGPWLPEPVDTTGSALGPLDTAELRESVSLALLLLLERLTPPERAVFVLREAFGYGHAEIAEVLDLTESNCQQLYHRARQHVASERPRFHPSTEERVRITQLFLDAARGGDLERLRSLLADDVVSWADGGGKIHAARKPIRGAERVAQYLGRLSREAAGVGFVLTELNGQPGVVATVDGVVLLAVALDIAEGGIATIRIVANPDKLGFLTAQLV
ncbi:RNA polymerase sigma-70 factor [Prauserella endophytica]|uniref:RNA polymerase sigma-70 factor n=1 Tax=Prauserella endophytica TaxID=1592324 RepID=UPI000D9BA389|nr:RNA polymerase sigma-70 factor [Prauserella endophytica]PXY21787.1 RNA polymerase subunit sigma-24 [Prauserella coralliicola]